MTALEYFKEKKEMTAVEYFKEKARMVRANEHGYCTLSCIDCPLYSENNPTGESCSNFERLHPEEAVSIVEKWSKEHPRKTRVQDFFEKHPNAPKFDGTPRCCAAYCGYCKHCTNTGIDMGNCVDCWNEPLE